VVGSVAWVFKNHGKDQLATKVEFEGSLKSPNISVIEIIGQVLYNAFIQALAPSLENSVNISSVDVKTGKEEKKPKGFFGKLFHHKKEKKEGNRGKSGG
jgi:hypothetical protein